MAKSRAELLGFAKREYSEVDGVRLQSLTELEQSELETFWQKRYRDTKDVSLSMRRELVVRCIVDDAGLRCFTDEEIDLIGEWPAALIVKLYEECRLVCGMDEARNVQVDATEKKSEATSD